ncbi:DeoR family transcriptional regulator [Algoriphagus pacificus]|uniref:DeoR family transcriptional regulator n=1 Tax=Algoriphagus pacificus TaxID=2811234 RepID=A0ABS3CKF8_9BACT|nr:DeoR family transcriptional regulator [Algoriphagus pacificus]MBN7817594.1 DeoR family transcriptional regulator [Algoriphagus pacificus]
MLESLITSKTRLRLLVKFFVNSKTHSHLRGLADEFGESTNAIRKELNNLTQAGILERHTDKNKIEYQANVQHPFFKNIQDIIRKYLGLDKLLEQILERMGEVHQVVLVGDIAKGIDSGKIDVLVSGESLNSDYINHLTTRVEDLIDRKVVFTLLGERITSPGLVLFDKEAGV